MRSAAAAAAPGGRDRREWPRLPAPPARSLRRRQHRLGPLHLHAAADDAIDILEAANQVNLNERREGAREQAKVDADFFNRFDDDADESDMRPSA